MIVHSSRAASSPRIRSTPGIRGRSDVNRSTANSCFGAVASAASTRCSATDGTYGPPPADVNTNARDDASASEPAAVNLALRTSDPVNNPGNASRYTSPTGAA